MADTNQVLKERIRSEFMADSDRELTDDTPLIEEEIIDSLGIFLLLGFMKEHFGVEVDPEDVTLENFSTVNTIVALIEGKRAVA
jgi:acyl carrier protein